ncbi:MAG: chemotaxis protein methyltransferase CheR [Kiritimatiellia bacterium]
MTDEDFRFVQTLVRSQAAIVLDDHKRYLVDSRLGGLSRKLSMAGITELVSAARGVRKKELQLEIIDAMTTNETSFFRDDVPWQALREDVMPELIQRRQSRKLRIWSAACSTGQEPYTLAMTIRTYFPRLAGWDITILATDISPTVLQRAKKGEYQRTEIGRGLDPVFRDKFFVESGRGKWQISEPIRKMIDFKALNLTSSFAGLGWFDLVLIRNVLIYFDPDTKRDILKRVQRQLAPDGYLLLGSGETTLNMGLDLVRKRHNRAWFYENG